jgi:hypothetical protein
MRLILLQRLLVRPRVHRPGKQCLQLMQKTTRHGDLCSAEERAVSWVVFEAAAAVLAAQGAH